MTGKDVKNGPLTTTDFSGSLRGEPGPAGVSGLVYPTLVLHNGSNTATTAYAWAACVNAS